MSFYFVSFTYYIKMRFVLLIFSLVMMSCSNQTIFSVACKLTARREQHAQHALAPPNNYNNYYNSYRHNSVSSPTMSECSEVSGTLMRRDDYIFHQSSSTEYSTPPPIMQQPVGFHPEFPSQNEAIPSYSDYYSYTDYGYYEGNPDQPFTQTGR